MGDLLERIDRQIADYEFCRPDSSDLLAECAERIGQLENELARWSEEMRDSQLDPADPLDRLHIAVNQVSHELDELRHWHETLNAESKNTHKEMFIAGWLARAEMEEPMSDGLYKFRPDEERADAERDYESRKDSD